MTDSRLLDQLKTEDNASFSLLYRFYYPAVEAHIIHNSGSSADAEDVFQEAIIVLLQQVRRPDFVLISSLKTYLFAIARNLWLKRLRNTRYTVTGDIGQVDQAAESAVVDLMEEELTQDEKVASWLTKITERCQRILKAIFFYEESMESLMQKMGWKNKHTAANQQYKCIQQVKKEKDKTS